MTHEQTRMQGAPAEAVGRAGNAGAGGGTGAGVQHQFWQDRGGRPFGGRDSGRRRPAKPRPGSRVRHHGVLHVGICWGLF